MKKRYLLVVLVVLFISGCEQFIPIDEPQFRGQPGSMQVMRLPGGGGGGSPVGNQTTSDYSFDSNGISREVLDNYLSRSITMGDLLWELDDAFFSRAIKDD